MITDNCKIYFCSESEYFASLTPVKCIPLFPETVSNGADELHSIDTIDADVTFEVPSIECIFKDLFTNKEKGKFNELCRRDLHRWFRENEPFVNDLAKDIAAASRSDFRILAKKKNNVTKVD